MNRQPSPNRNSLDPGAIRQRGHQRSRSASHTETYQSIQQHSPTKFGSAATSRNNLSYSSTSLLSLLSSSTSSPVKAVTKPNHKHRRVQSYSSVTPSSTNSRSNSDEDEEEKDEPIDCYIPVCRTLAQDWYSGGKFHIEGTRFKDCFGRTLQLRGVNLCGHSKLPTSLHSNNPGHPNFFDHRNVSFIGRPFKLEEVDEHFSRLRVWGLTFVRLLVPWEALEHAGPGIYDDEYIDYLIKVLEKAPQYGLKCFIDPHQDVWSRFSGGSGAPGWTFEVAGMDIRKFKVTGAAYIQDMNEQIPVVDGPPPMIWPTNYTKLASSTMFTLFFAGDCFAPKLECQGQSIQRFLQTKFINCYKHLAERLKHLDAVVGFELMNEPHQGYIGLDNLKKYDPISTLIFDDSPSALESFALGHGIPQEVEHWVRSWPFPTRKAGTRLLNTERQSVWLPGFTCPWKEHGVWDVDPTSGEPILLKPDYFIKHPKTGKHVDFNQDFYLPFVNEYAAAIQSVSDSLFVLVEPIPNELPPVYSPTSHHHNIVYAPHWYDLKSVFSKSFNSFITHDVQALRISKNLVRATYFGIHGAKKNYTKQVANIKESGLTRIGAKPVVIGECGIPMDINERKAFETGDYTHHNNFLDAVISAMESNLVHFTYVLPQCVSVMLCFSHKGLTSFCALGYGTTILVTITHTGITGMEKTSRSFRRNNKHSIHLPKRNGGKLKRKNHLILPSTPP
ncbi:glycoside hydrolase superfamily [Paraphysoderma sedebokerense]|nr:glycoside hydrolase superfamily [Paraphysoderma sedebokerense]